jgi:N-methylhydantoinase A
VEWVNLRVTGVGPIPRPRLVTLAAGDGDPSRAVTGHRAVVFARAGGPVDATIYWRPALGAGDEVTGPAVIEEYGATIPVHPGFTARVDGFGNLLVGPG